MEVHRQPIGLGPREVAHTDPARLKTARIARAKKPARAAASRMPFYGTLAGFLVASVAAVGIGASLDSPRSLMTRHDYVEAKKVIEAEERQALAQCRSLDGTRKALCRVTARAEDRIRRAELEARYRGTVEAEADVYVVRARASFDVARTRCDERVGDARSQCLRDARVERSRALADAKPSTT